MSEVNHDQSNGAKTPPPSPQLPPEPPEYLDSAFFEMALHKKYPDIKVTSLDIEPAVGVGENYMSLVFRAQVGTSHGPFSLIIKCIPEGELRVKMINENDITIREMRIYDTILPMFQRNLPEENDLKPSTPPSFFSIKEGLRDALVLQDLRPYGYRTVDRKFGLDKQHCVVALRELAKLHAFSVELRITEPAMFQKEIVENFVEKLYTENNTELFGTFLVNSLGNIADGVREFFPFRFHELANVLDGLRHYGYDLLCDIFKYPEDLSERILVLNHGDFWCNNMLFQYKSKDDTEPLACSMIDFQIAKCCSPAIDLQYFFYSSTDQSTRRQNMNELLQIYLDQVHESLRALNVSYPLPKNMFYSSVAEIKDEMKKFRLYGMVASCFVMPVAVANSEDAPDMDSMTEEEMKSEMSPFKKLYAGALFQRRFKEILEDFDDLGFFEYYKKMNNDRAGSVES